MPQEQKPNRLIKETSPYLLQHANNPVDWFPWGDEAFEKAKKENKPVLISIGYSSCHWCHVMEHESFEDEATAKVQNDLFISIKVDREERPDVDQVYMDAVQAMGIQGGWPLNVFVTPEGKPFYGGTYFPPARWRSLLTQLAERYEDNPEKIQNTANELTQFLQTSETTKYGLEDTVVVYDEAHLHKLYRLFEKDFDTKMGGLNRAPKFPLPNNYLFLLRYYNLSKNLELFNQLELTLNRMAWGGIYDQVGGGFARYSTDDQWIVPHFEKMLYDNGQLVSLYAEAYTLTKKARYKTVIRETLEFIEREMTSNEGGFYSALDADSEGEEGKFYVWDWNELESLLGDDLELFADYYNIRPQGNWEHSNILYKTESDSAFLVDKQIDEATFDKKVKEWKKTLLEARSKRIRPGLDDKILTSWNGLMLKGYSDAYRAIGDKHFLDMAIKNADFILTKMKDGEKLWHTYKAEKATVQGFLDDYALVIEAFISLYQATFDEKWLLEAKALTDYTIKEFYDVDEKLFYYTSESSSSLIVRKKELFDNVISSSNSVMANNLYFLGHYFEGSNYLEMSHGMLARVNNMMAKNPQYLANWATLYSYNVHPTAEIAIVGDDYLDVRREIENIYIPNKLLVGSKNGSSALPLLEHREAINDETTIYVCFNKTCKLPVNDVEKALRQIPEVYQ